MSTAVSDQPTEQETSTIRVVVVDDHHLVRDGLRAVLDGEAGIEVVGEVGGKQGKWPRRCDVPPAPNRTSSP